MVMENIVNNVEEYLLLREEWIFQVCNLVEIFWVVEEIVKQGYLIISLELVDLMDINFSVVISWGDYWLWCNWVVFRVRREGN